MTSNRRVGDRDAKLGIISTSEKLREDTDPEKKIKRIEEEIQILINDSNILLVKKNLIKALEKAKEAQKKMKQFERYLDNNDFTDFLNSELFFSVGMNLANIYEKNKVFSEALSQYKKLLNARANESSFLVRVNMGNLYFQ